MGCFHADLHYTPAQLLSPALQSSRPLLRPAGLLQPQPRPLLRPLHAGLQLSMGTMESCLC